MHQFSSAVDLTSAGAGQQKMDTSIVLNKSVATGTGHSFDLTIPLDPTVGAATGHSIGVSFAATAMNSDTDTINLGYAHNYTTGQKVLFTDLDTNTAMANAQPAPAL